MDGTPDGQPGCGSTPASTIHMENHDKPRARFPQMATFQRGFPGNRFLRGVGVNFLSLSKDEENTPYTEFIGVPDMKWARIGMLAGLLSFAAQTAEAAAPPRTMDLEILANGRLILRGELIEGVDDLEARLRVMRDSEPPFELRLKLPKTFSFDTIASFMNLAQRLGLSLGLIGESTKPPPVETESSTI